jgi:hypothetical protein
MKVIFSRKGFDSTSGGAPSPIIDGRPISLPIPTKNYPSETSYSDVGLGEILEQVTKRRKRRIRASELCHEDPMFANGRWAFGQCGAAQTHLEKNEVGVGDVFLFYGLFSSHDKDRHHRIFGYMKVEEVRLLGPAPSKNYNPEGFERRHPHTLGEWVGRNANNTLYLGSGFKARRAPSILRLTKPGARVSVWNIPPWLKAVGLTYHNKSSRWVGEGELHVASPGQEFVADIGEQKEPLKWLHDVKAAIRL